MISLRSASLGLGLVLLGVVIPMTPAATELLAQEPRAAPTVSATMLRVLAEAADVYRSGKPVYLVADYRYPHNVLRAFASKAAADKVRADSGANYGVFGPYVTTPDVAPDTANRILAIRVLMKTPEGNKTVAVDPRQADALFLSMSAVDKFVLPYYQKILGPDYALKLRDKALEAMRSRLFLRHCYSWICEDTVGPMKVIDPGVPTPGPREPS